MTLLFSTLRASSESMSVPLENRGSLVTRHHCYCTLKYNGESSSHQCTVPHTQACSGANFPHAEESSKKKSASFKRERAALHLQPGRGNQGSKQTLRVTSGPTEVHALASLCTLRLSRRDTDIPP